MRYSKYGFTHKTQQTIIAFCLGLVLALLGNSEFNFKLAPVFGQNLRPEMVAEQLYQNLAFLPLENEYLNQRSDEVAEDNTLMLRFLRYHEYVKSRPVQYRFDWQLTFADYFGVNEPINDNRYPGYKTLKTNPLKSDRKIITQLTRAQRNQIIDALLAIYNPQADTPQPEAVTPPQNAVEERDNQPDLPQPGDAELLLPTQ